MTLTLRRCRHYATIRKFRIGPDTSRRGYRMGWRVTIVDCAAGRVVTLEEPFSSRRDATGWATVKLAALEWLGT